MNRHERVQKLIRTSVCVGAVVVMAAQMGCYRRVIGVKGPGGIYTPTSESYQEGQGGAIDRWLFGEPEQRRKSSGSRL